MLSQKCCQEIKQNPDINNYIFHFPNIQTDTRTDRKLANLKNDPFSTQLFHGSTQRPRLV